MVITTQQLARQLGELDAAQRIVCVHPNFKAAHLILNAAWENTLYIRFLGAVVSDDQLQAQLDEAVQSQTGQTAPDGSGQFMILDEADRVDPGVLLRLLRKFLAASEPMRVIVVSRLLVDGLLEDAALRAQTVFLPAEPNQMLWNYAAQSDEILLEVRAFGEGRVHLNGQRVHEWDGALPRALFFYLVDRGMVTRAEIFQTFWPTLSTREATNVFHVTKRKISEVLKTELTVYGSSFYHISPRIQLSYDVSLFNQALQESDSDDGRGAALRDALALYRGDYLYTLNSVWARSRRDALQQAACDALVSLGRLCEADGKQQEALGSYLRALRLRPEREDAAHAAMRLYRDLSLPEDGLRVYRLLTKTLRKSLNVAPSPHVQQLAAQIGL